MVTSLDEPKQKYSRYCKNEEERRERYLAAQKRYNTKEYYCELCDTNIKKHNKKRHEKHIKYRQVVEVENNIIENLEIPIQ